MPRPPIRPDPLIEAGLAEIAEFEEPSAWRRSQRGNLWRNWKGVTVTVFRRQGDGYFAWSIADDEGVRFSPGGFTETEEAISDLAGALGVGEWG